MKKMLSMSLLSVFTTFSAAGQGCSDAGFCTVDAFKSTEGDSARSETKNHLKIGASFGKADHDITIVASYVEYGRQFTEKWGADLKVTQLSQFGNGIQSNGLSDLFLTEKYVDKRKIAYTAGIKFPFSNGGKSLNGLSLPHDFQSSLGTIDLLAGISKEWKSFRLSAALQQPITQNNNGFFSSNYDSTAFLSGFQSTNQFQRKGDVLLRLTYTWLVGQRWKIIPGLLPIYHLGEDSYENEVGQRTNISGSDGLTLNGTVFIQYGINRSNKLEASFGMPFIVRAIRPDGLTRSFVIALEYKWLF